MKYYNSEHLVLETYATSLYENFLDAAKQLDHTIKISLFDFLLAIKSGPEKFLEYCIEGLGLSPSIAKSLEIYILIKENGKYRYPNNILFEELQQWDEEQVKRFALKTEEKRYMFKSIY